MAARKCCYCSKPLPRELRSDARYCPGSRCRVYAYRKRQSLGAKLPPTRRAAFLQQFSAEPKPSKRSAVVDYLQKKRTQAKLPLLVQDEYLQAEAEKQACEIMDDMINKMEFDARRRSYNAWGKWHFEQEEQFVHSHIKINISPKATHLGLAMIPDALGGGIVVYTARSRS